MTSVQSGDARVKSLVAQFVEIVIAQYDAMYAIDNAKYNWLFTRSIMLNTIGYSLG
jgi:hypothetical protein